MNYKFWFNLQWFTYTDTIMIEMMFSMIRANERPSLYCLFNDIIYLLLPNEKEWVVLPGKSKLKAINNFFLAFIQVETSVAFHKKHNEQIHVHANDGLLSRTPVNHVFRTPFFHEFLLLLNLFQLVLNLFAVRLLVYCFWQKFRKSVQNLCTSLHPNWYLQAICVLQLLFQWFDIATYFKFSTWICYSPRWIL